MFSPLQLTVNASTASVHGFSHLLQKRRTRIYRLCGGPIRCPRQQNTLGLTCYRPHPSGVTDSQPLYSTLMGPILDIVI